MQSLQETVEFIRNFSKVSSLTLSYNVVKILGNLIDDKQGAIEFHVGKLLCRRIMKLLDLEIDLEGAAIIDELRRKDIPYAVVSTHASYLDWVLILGFFPTPVRFIAKKELSILPGIGSFLKQRGVLIDRSKGKTAKAAIQAAIKDDINWPILIFPEGTRSKDGRVQPFRRGGLKLLADAGLTLVPLTIAGTHRVSPRDKAVLRSGGRLGLFIDDPIDTKDFSDSDACIDRIEDIINHRSEEVFDRYA